MDENNLVCTEEIINDVNFEITYKLLQSCLHDEITSILKSYKDHGIGCVRTATMKTYVNKMFQSHFNVISDYSKVTQDLYILHLTCRAFYHYNENILGLTHQDFRAKILYPNIIYMIVRFLNGSHRFLQSTIRVIYNEISSKSYGIIQKYANAYYTDENTIKSDVFYEFLGNGMKKINPLTIDNIDVFYKQVFRNVFYYYFKKEEKAHTIYSSIWDVDTNVGRMINVPTRLSIYRDVLYNMQIKKFCKRAPTLEQVVYNYSIFRNVIINNEFQNMYYSCKTDTFMLNDNQYKILKIYDNDSKDYILKEIKKLPLIYKLLKCVHIINPKGKPYNEMLIKPEIVKNAILDQLFSTFRNMFSDPHVYNILEKISHNFTSSILSGEYINLFTLSTVKIHHVSFLNQIKQFVNLCINEATSNVEGN